MPALLRQPLLHFLLLGSALFLLERAWTPASAAIEPIVLDQALTQQLARDWQRDTGQWPTVAEQRAVVHGHLQEQRLLREALRLGLAERDPVVRLRLVDNLRFLAPDRQADDAALLREALALNMAEHDVVARRRLVQIMGERLSGAAVVDRAAVRRHIEAHPERYAPPTRYRVTHRFIAGDYDRQRADLLLRVLQSGSPSAAGAGDPFLLGPLPTWVTLPELRRWLGPSVAEGVATLPLNQWSPPLPSAWGWHLMRIDAQDTPALQVTPELYRRATYAWLAERDAQLLDQALQQLATRYPEDWRVTLPIDPS